MASTAVRTVLSSSPSSREDHLYSLVSGHYFIIKPTDNQLHASYRTEIPQTRRRYRTTTSQTREKTGTFGHMLLLSGRLDVLVRLDEWAKHSLDKSTASDGTTWYSDVGSFRQLVSRGDSK